MNVPSVTFPRVLPPATAATRALPTAGPAPRAGAPATASEPAFLELLTPEEREFFTQQSALGSLAYGRRGGTRAQCGSGGAVPGPLGGRLDVRG